VTLQFTVVFQHFVVYLFIDNIFVLVDQGTPLTQNQGPDQDLMRAIQLSLKAESSSASQNDPTKETETAEELTSNSNEPSSQPENDASKTHSCDNDIQQ
jgi:endonuclease/exonuclease/phosphatase (EEP) superfamily protein YafD